MKVDVEKELELVEVDILFSQDQHNPIYLAKQVSSQSPLASLCLILGFDISAAQLGFQLSNAYKTLCDLPRLQPFGQIPYFEDGDIALFG